VANRKSSSLPVTDLGSEVCGARSSLRSFTHIALLVLLSACGPSSEQSEPLPSGAPSFVGSSGCQACHKREFDAWKGSHHSLAMQHATVDTVLGDFGGVDFRHIDTVSNFSRRNENFYVRTDSENGEMREYQVVYTFGVSPLQQYLVELPRGRLQALPIAWDSRPEDEGGQRWFHLYPNEAIDYTDALHWTGRDQNWNFMCAECHSTNLQKNYNAETKSFDTTWAEISVGCEGCHGPGSLHVKQATEGKFKSWAGLLTDLDDSGQAVWNMNLQTGIAARSEPRMSLPSQPEACGRCHSRRSSITDSYQYNRPLLDTHSVSLLSEYLYHPDGQVLDEVYVYGSFLQSRMYRAGVTCSDCHDPHTSQLYTGDDPNGVCGKCHLPDKFDKKDHHRHPPQSVKCVDCHMASKTYMVIDDRRDHSFRIPRPDITKATGSPNACNDCHVERSVEWAEDIFNGWFGDELPDHYGFDIHAGISGGGNMPLVKAAMNQTYPGIARATALSFLQAPYSQEVVYVIQNGLANADPMIRISALRALRGLAVDLQVNWGASLLNDSVRAVRVEAATVISPLRTGLPEQHRMAFAKAEAELKKSILTAAERPEAQARLANLYADSGDIKESVEAFSAALHLEPRAIQARVNLADLYRRLDRDEEAEIILREGIADMPEEPAYHHSLGLLLVRQQQPKDGLEQLAIAANLQADNARYAYVYAVALNSLGEPEMAISYLKKVQTKFSDNFDIHWALATMLRDQGRNVEARIVIEKISNIYPGVESLTSFLDSLTTDLNGN